MSVASKIFRENLTDYTYPMARSVFARLVLVAGSAGLIAWLFSLAFDRLMLTPVFCSTQANAAMCANSVNFSAYVGLVLVGVMILPILITLGIKRPLVVVASATAALWGVTAWTGGAWWLSLLLTVATSILSYAAIVWINRIRSNLLAISLIILFVILVRVVLTL